MKKVLCGFAFGLMLMVAGAQAWADVGYPLPSPNPKLAHTGLQADVRLADTGYPIPTPNPKFTHRTGGNQTE